MTDDELDQFFRRSKITAIVISLINPIVGCIFFRKLGLLHVRKITQADKKSNKIPYKYPKNYRWMFAGLLYVIFVWLLKIQIMTPLMFMILKLPSHKIKKVEVVRYLRYAIYCQAFLDILPSLVMMT